MRSLSYVKKTTKKLVSYALVIAMVLTTYPQSSKAMDTKLEPFSMENEEEIAPIMETDYDTNNKLEGIELYIVLQNNID